MFLASAASRFQAPRLGLIIWSGGWLGHYGEEIGTSGAFDNFITVSDRNAMRARGFDTIRMPTGLGALATASAGTRTTNINRFVANNVTLVNAGFKVLMCLEPDGVSGYDHDAIFDGVSGTKWTQVKAVWAELAAAIAAVRNPAKIAIEPINEPGNPDNATLLSHMLALHASIRSADELSTIFTCPNFGQAEDRMRAMDGTILTDPRIGFAFHWYPEPYTQQGIGGAGYHRAYHDIPFPPVAGDHTAQSAALETHITENGVEEPEATFLRGDFEPYYTIPKDATWRAGVMSTINTWRAGLGLAEGMVICSEWSVTGDASDHPGMNYPDRVAAIAAHRQTFAAANIPCVYNSLFDGGVGQGALSADTARTWDDGVIGALQA